MFAIARRAFLLSAGALALRPPLFPARAAAEAAAPPAYPYALPALGYGYDANEPAIDALTMQIHHDKHHAAYVANLNAALKDHPDLQALPLAELLAHVPDLPEAIRAPVRNNAGGHANHTLYWQILGGKGGEPEGALKEAIERDFGAFAEFRSAFDKAALGVFGSGWAFLIVDAGGKLAVQPRPNQDSPWTQRSAPLLANDVWEHAYYLKYHNLRADYVNAFWSVVNWPAVGERYAAFKAGALAI